MGLPRRCRGQAAVEFLALVPAVVILLLVLVQSLLLAGAWMSASGAARAAVRAAEVGAPPDDAARAALPDGLARRARVSSAEHKITVEVRVDALVPGVGRFRVAAASPR